MRIAAALVVIAAAGCVRETAEPLCPAVGPGELVVTEIRGPQADDDTLGPWVEIYNASGESVDLRGLTVAFRRRDGSGDIPVIIRSELASDADTYVVLGLFQPGAEPAHVNYGIAADYRKSWLGSAAIDVESCGTLIDRVIYDPLPAMGSLSLGSMPPSATDNDVPIHWCPDAVPVDTEYPGTPQQPNHPCP
ncbi:MAG: hypothetical protein AB7P03_05735 [Kofleriaceae bacterium]